MKTFRVREILFIILLSLSGVYSVANSLDEGQAEIILNTTEWQKLLHFEKNRSQIHSQEFFLNPDGKNNYLGELKSNISLFNNDSNYACRFPARAQYFAKKLNIEYKKCFEVEAWKELINAESVALVYVTQYVSNPVSIFGHSFLLFQNRTRPINLDVAFNNAAQVPEKVSTYDYVVKGMFGGFPTVYTKEPFYLKIQEYNNIENRGQWLYQLNLTKAEIDQLLNHLWELANLKKEEYFFLNVNCALNIYNALAAVRPDLNFISDKKLYVLPVQTLKKAGDIITEITYHPSIREKIVQRYKKLNDSDSKEIDEAEISLELFEFKKSQNHGQLSAVDLAAYNHQLVERSKLGRRKTLFLYKWPEYPTFAHPTWNLSLGFTEKNEQSATSLAFSPFHHALLQSQVGFLPHSEIIVLKFRIVKVESEPTYFDQLSFIKMSNFVEVSHFDSQYSWQFDTKLNRKVDSGYYFNGFIDVGKAKSFFDNHMFYGLLGFNFAETQTLHPEIRAGVLSSFSKLNLKLQLHTLQDNDKKVLNKNVFELEGNYQIAAEFDINLTTAVVKEKTDYYLNLNYNF